MIVTHQKDIIADDKIIVFIDDLYKKANTSNEITPFSIGFSKMSGINDPFSFIQDDATNGVSITQFDMNTPQNFVFLDTDDKKFNIDTPIESERGQRGNIDSKMLENLRAQRDLDIQKVRPTIERI